MFNGFNFAPLHDFFVKILIFWDRPLFRLQSLAISIAIVLACLLTRFLEPRIQKLELQLQLYLPQYLETYTKRFFIIIHYLLFPLSSLITIWITKLLLLFAGLLVGLLNNWLSLFLVLLLYRLFLGILYAFFARSAVISYHYYFLAPLFCLYFIQQLLSDLTNLESLSQVVLTSVFANALTIGSLFSSIVGLYIWIGFLSGIQDLLYLLITKRTNIEPGVVEGVLASSRYLLIGFGLIVVLGQLGLNPTTVAAITGGLSVGLGFSLREILSNFISGILLFFEGALKPGDVIEVEGEIAVVKRVSIRATTVQTFNHVEKIVPNQQFLTSSVINYTGSDRICRYLIPIGVSYKSEPQKVIEILLKVAHEHPKVLKKPKPTVFLTGFGDSSINFELSIWLDNQVIRKPVTSDLNQAIWKAFAEQNIEIPFPQRDLHIYGSNS